MKTNDFWPQISKFCVQIHIFGPGDQWIQHNRGGLTKGTTFGQKTTMYAPNHKKWPNIYLKGI